MNHSQNLKECVIILKNGFTFTQYFNSDWTNHLIQSYMFDNCHIVKDDVSEIRISHITIYKNFN